ncbi:MAG TPA: vanadium-dependent haloperoxidase [Chitinophagaceae bacterium]
MKKIQYLIWVFILACNSSAIGNNKSPIPDYLQLDQAIRSVSMVMMHDVVSPPVASRYYSYALLGAYDLVAQNNKEVPPASEFINGYNVDEHILTQHDKFDYKIAAVYSILETMKQMLPSGFMLQDDQDKYVALLKKNRVKEITIRQSIAVAVETSQKIIDFSKSDNYNKLSAKLRYTPLKGDGFWYPTPPAYLEAVEPNFQTLRPMFLDSCSQFKPSGRTLFSSDSSSNFYKMAKEVYDAGNNMTKEQNEIASFWDCNPFTVETSGHMMIGFKKITPGGHWMNISCIAAKKANLSFDKSVLVVGLSAFAMVDAFISCWDEKFRSNRIRPETYINRYINLKWTPLLQTPPFPEYTSGHAVLSNVAAEILTYLFGDNFSYTDDSETPFGIAPRHFTSFRQAASEASISRLYGGIHFRDAIENGNQQGKDIADYIINKLKKCKIMQQNTNAG